MTTLHIKAASGPRPVSAAAVRVLLSDGRVTLHSQVLSLDRGATWLPVGSALAVVDGACIDDAVVDHALSAGRLHPMAMPLGAAAGILLIAGIAFGGGSAATTVAVAPEVMSAAAVGITRAGASRLADSGAAIGQLATAGWTACFAAGPASSPVTSPARVPFDHAVTTPPDATPAAGPLIDLRSAWSAMVADHGSTPEAWTGQAGQLAGLTTAQGITDWKLRLVMSEAISDANRATAAKEFPGARKPLAWAMLEGDGGLLTVMLVTENAQLAARLEDLATKTHDVTIQANAGGVVYAAESRTVAISGTLTAIE